MRDRNYGPVVLLLAVLASVSILVASLEGRSVSHKPASASPNPPAACTFPTMPAATPEETAWQLFVAANCAVSSTKVVWETWVEQDDLYPKNGVSATALNKQAAHKRLHGSPLARAATAQKGGIAIELDPHEECNKMSVPPANVTNTQICEEARLNPAAQNFVIKAANRYQTRPPQTKAAQSGTDIEFPTAAIEVKVDWIPASDFTPPFTCTKPPQGVHAKVIDGACYAMAGMHISSKLLKNWIWATFEPQSMLTNPLRCITFGSCKDSWGSNPATSNGGAAGFTDQTPAVKALMKQANLAPEFFNYRMDGVQTTFTNADGTPTYLGNSVIEGENVGLKKNQASCITCHSVSSIKNDGEDGVIQLGSANTVGAQYQVPSGWIARDFVWSLGLACPTAPAGGGLQQCTTAAKLVKKETPKPGK